VVWVGPYLDKASLTKAKKRLEDAGMTNLFKKP
jgi:cell division protein FtsN